MEKSIWIARDKDGTLTIFDDKPILDCDNWYNEDEYAGNFSIIASTFFPEITFENSPKELIIK